MFSLLRPSSAEDAAKAAEFSKTVAAAKDVTTVALLIQQQLHRPPNILLQIKDAESLTVAKSAFQELSARVTVISQRLEQLPVPSATDREAIAKKMEAADAANGKKLQPLLQAHMKAMPEELKTAAMQEMTTFYQGLDVHGKVFQKYFQPDEKPSPEVPKKPAPAKTEKS